VNTRQCLVRTMGATGYARAAWLVPNPRLLTARRRARLGQVVGGDHEFGPAEGDGGIVSGQHINPISYGTPDQPLPPPPPPRPVPGPIGPPHDVSAPSFIDQYGIWLAGGVLAIGLVVAIAASRAKRHERRAA
jgi:hypothetical protein